MAEQKRRGRPTKKELEARRIEEERARKAQQRRTITAIVLIALGMLFTALAFVEGDALWAAVHKALFGVFGWLAYLVGHGLFLMGIIAVAKRPVDGVDVLKLVLLLLSLSGATYIFSVARPSSKGAWNIIKELYLLGADRIGTGVISAVLGWPLEYFLGSVGAKITIVILALVAFMLLTSWTPWELIRVVSWPFRMLYRCVVELGSSLAEYRTEERQRKQSLEYLREKSDYQEKSKRIDIPMSDKKPFDVDALSEPVSFQPDREQRTYERGTNLPNIDVEMGPEFDPTVEGVELNPTGPAADLVLDLWNNPPKEEVLPEPVMPVQQNEPTFALAENAGGIDKETEQRLNRRKGKASEVDQLAKKADDEYLKNSNTPGVEVKQRRTRRYMFPPISLLEKQKSGDQRSLENELSQNAELLVRTLKSFGVNTRVINISRGPTVTRYELQPESGVRLSRIVNLSDDIAMNMAATSVRIEAPIPGKAAVGVEIPNRTVQTVNLRPIIESEEFQKGKGQLLFSLGKDITGAVRVGDIEKMPHLLIAGATGMGKSVCINSILVSLLYKYTPNELRMILVDPKMVEFNAYNGLPHLYVPVVTDAKKAAGALGWAVSEMMKRYRLFSESGNRNIEEYNRWVKKKLEAGRMEPEEDLELLPRVIIVIDELADLMMVAPNEVEDAIARLAQMARAAGMHLILATQRPSVDVITGVIKNNIPSRIAFAVSSQVDSRTILDGAGAEKLLGRGDMLYMPVGTTKPTRIQGSWVSQEEVDQVVGYIKDHNQTDYDEGIVQDIDRMAVKEKGKGGGFDDGDEDGRDENFLAAAEVVVEAGQGSTSMLQRKLRLGYARAARIMDELEEAGIIGPQEGSKPRAVLWTRQDLLEYKTTQSE